MTIEPSGCDEHFWEVEFWNHMREINPEGLKRAREAMMKIRQMERDFETVRLPLLEVALGRVPDGWGVVIVRGAGESQWGAVLANKEGAGVESEFFPTPLMALEHAMKLAGLCDEDKI